LFSYDYIRKKIYLQCTQGYRIEQAIVYTSILKYVDSKSYKESQLRDNKLLQHDSNLAHKPVIKGTKQPKMSRELEKFIT